MMMNKLLELTKGKTLTVMTHPKNSEGLIFYIYALVSIFLTGKIITGAIQNPDSF